MTVNGVTTTYRLVGDRVTFEQTGSDTIYYVYDTQGQLISMILNNVEYAYVRNAQNDIVGLINSAGIQVVSYTYSTWGEVLSITGSLASSVGEKNPYRYRGYRYDSETQLYYLQSRYYNPQWGRFLNADEPAILLLTQGQLLGTNLFAYCLNNPVMNSDPTGYMSIQQAANLLNPSVIFGSFMSMLFNDLAYGLTQVGIYVTKVLLPKVVVAFWYNPWLVTGIVVGAVAIAVAAVAIIYNTRVAQINNGNMDRKVKDILKTKKGSIKQAPLPPGGPNWNDLLEKTLREIQNLADNGVKGYKEICKLLKDGRFNR